MFGLQVTEITNKMDITIEELKERLDKGEKLNLFDVREEYEFDEYNIGATLS